MSKLTRAQRRTLEQALYDLNRGIEYLMSPRTAVCLRGRATTGLDFTRKLSAEAAANLLSPEQLALGDYALTEVTKEYGSNLCGVFTAKRTLEQFLNA
jgi:hypothetical protein